MRAIPEIDWFFYDYRWECGLKQDSFPENTNAVGFDRVAAFRMLISHSADKGYRNLCFRAPFYTDEKTFQMAQQKNIELLGIQSGDSLEKFADAIPEKIKNCRRTAFCFPDDLKSIQLIKLLRERGLHIPGDAGAISWDGLPVSCHFSPVLETLAIPHDRMSAAAADFLAGNGGGFVEFSPEIRPGETLPVIGE